MADESDDEVQEVPLTTVLRPPAFNLQRLTSSFGLGGSSSSPLPKSSSSPPASAARSSNIASRSEPSGTSVHAGHALPPRVASDDSSGDQKKKDVKEKTNKDKEKKQAKKKDKKEKTTRKKRKQDEDDEEPIEETYPLTGGDDDENDSNGDDDARTGQEAHVPKDLGGRGGSSKRPAANVSKKPATKSRKRADAEEHQEPNIKQTLEPFHFEITGGEEAHHDAAELTPDPKDTGLWEYPDNQLGLQDTPYKQDPRYALFQVPMHEGIEDASNPEMAEEEIDTMLQHMEGMALHTGHELDWAQERIEVESLSVTEGDGLVIEALPTTPEPEETLPNTPESEESTQTLGSLRRGEEGQEKIGKRRLLRFTAFLNAETLGVAHLGWKMAASANWSGPTW
ncbi:unnamed protein product [Cladocopium goreaui]|uniref:Uncharacterized protein n=1 Tax=Cladocopium goreaui TaxID=2562237 RepID=A0A9P1M360_9DINO|nr:unnamed protein product [Cladocopium goreaui]